MKTILGWTDIRVVLRQTLGWSLFYQFSNFFRDTPSIYANWCKKYPVKYYCNWKTGRHAASHSNLWNFGLFGCFSDMNGDKKVLVEFNWFSLVTTNSSDIWQAVPKIFSNCDRWFPRYGSKSERVPPKVAPPRANARSSQGLRFIRP
jgi:hypothetical protein